MHSRTLWLAMASIGFIALAASSQANSMTVPTDGIAKAVKKLTQTPKPKEVVNQLEGKMTELKALKENASTITKKIGDLASEGKLPTNDEGIKLLQDLVQQLKESNDNLRKVQEDVKGILSWIEGEKKTVSTVNTDIKQLKKFTPTAYVQFQWQDTETDANSSTPRNDGFQMRRLRLGQRIKLDDKFSAKLSFDLATGSNRQAAEMKDAQLIYDVEPSGKDVGTQIVFGQQPLPLGYELQRSSGDREFPERTLYNQRLFAGERDRGVNVKYGIGNGVFLQAGLWNGITVNDPQIVGANTFRDLDNQVAFTAGVRATGKHYDVGVSALKARRPGFTPSGGGAVVPDVNREIFVVDATYTGFLTEALSLRGEFLAGRDRDPIGGTANPTFRQQTNVRGWQAQANYAFDASNALSFRYQFYDPDTSDVATTNNNVRVWGLAYIHFFNPGFKITVSYENPNEQGTNRRDSVWTFRTQFRL